MAGYSIWHGVTYPDIEYEVSILAGNQLSITGTNVLYGVSINNLQAHKFESSRTALPANVVMSSLQTVGVLGELEVAGGVTAHGVTAFYMGTTQIIGITGDFVYLKSPLTDQLGATGIYNYNLGITTGTSIATVDRHLNELGVSFGVLGATVSEINTRLDTAEDDIIGLDGDVTILNDIMFVNYLIPPLGVLVPGSLQFVLDAVVASAAASATAIGVLSTNVGNLGTTVTSLGSSVSLLDYELQHIGVTVNTFGINKISYPIASVVSSGVSLASIGTTQVTLAVSGVLQGVTANIQNLNAHFADVGLIHSAGGMNIDSGGFININSLNTLSQTTLGSAVVNSSLTSLGNVTSLNFGTGIGTTMNATTASGTTGAFTNHSGTTAVITNITGTTGIFTSLTTQAFTGATFSASTATGITGIFPNLDFTNAIGTSLTATNIYGVTGTFGALVLPLGVNIYDNHGDKKVSFTGLNNDETVLFQNTLSIYDAPGSHFNVIIGNTQMNLNQNIELLGTSANITNLQSTNYIGASSVVTSAFGTTSSIINQNWTTAYGTTSVLTNVIIPRDSVNGGIYDEVNTKRINFNLGSPSDNIYSANNHLFYDYPSVAQNLLLSSTKAQFNNNIQILGISAGITNFKTNNQQVIGPIGALQIDNATKNSSAVILFNNQQSSNSVASTVWGMGYNSNNIGTTSFGFYTNGNSNILRMDSTGLVTCTTASIATIDSSLASMVTSGSLIDFGIGSIGAPGFSTPKSAGQKITLFNQNASAQFDVAIGMETNDMWFSCLGITSSPTTYGFTWWNNQNKTTPMMALRGYNLGVGTNSPAHAIDVNTTAGNDGNINVPTGSGYLVNGTSVLSGTVLGGGVVSSSLTSVGTLTTLTVTGTAATISTITTSGNGNSVILNNTNASFSNILLLLETSRAANTGSTLYLYCQANGINTMLMWTNGDIRNTNNSYGAISDASVKKDIVPSRDYLADLMKVRIVNYDWTHIEDQPRQLGVVAQELEEIFPGLVEFDTKTNLKSVKYSVLNLIAIKSLQELASEHAILVTKFDALEAKMEVLEKIVMKK